MKFAFFFLTFTVLLGAYHARHLHDVSIYTRFDRRPSFKAAEVIQMVTGDEKLRSPPSAPPLFSDDLTTYGRVNQPPPPPKVAPSKGQTTYAGENPNSKGHTTSYNEQQGLTLTDSLNPLSGGPQSPKIASSQGETIYGRDNPKAPSPPKVAPSRGQTTFGKDNPNSNSQTISLEELADNLATKSTKPDSSRDPIASGRDDPMTSVAEIQMVHMAGHGMYGRSDPRKPPSPNPNGSQGQGMYGQDDPIKRFAWTWYKWSS